MKKLLVPVGVSAHHIHLSLEDFNKLFPGQKELTKKLDLSQPGQFACEEQLNVVSLDPKGKSIERVRILGPLRKQTQVELLRSECTKAKIAGPTRSSGDTKGSGGCKLVNPLNGNEVIISEGVIVADRHIHLSTKQAENYSIKDRQIVCVKVDGAKGGLMGEVLCRVNDEFDLDFHIDVDDACAFDVKQGQELEVLV
ncbi:MAG: phosphate propanoyltransferase [Anaeroplasmataceae bacterium]